jgi:hypothetical protein
MTDATVVIKGRNELGLAVKQAEQQLKNLARTGDLVGKVLRGGAIIGAVVAFERLAENAERAALAIGDKGTAKSLHELNRAIDTLKSKGLNIIGKALGESFALTGAAGEIAKIDAEISRLEAHLKSLDLVGIDIGRAGLLDAIKLLKETRRNAEALEKSFTSRRGFAVGRGNDGNNRVRTRYSSAFDPSAEEIAAAKAAAKAIKDALEEASRLDFNASVLKSETEVAKRVADYYEKVAFNADIATEAQESSLRGLEEFTDQMERSYDAAAKQTDAISIFAEQAARNMQDSFANFFYSFDGGLKGMLASFVDTLHQMTSQLFAQQALNSFFTWGAGKFAGSGVGNFFTSLGKGLTGKASGGSVYGGTPYLVGEKGPELFVPGASGSIVPNHAMGGASITYNIDARGADAERIMSVMPGLLKQTEDRTIARIRDMNGRGRL